MENLNVNKAGLALGSLFGLMHLVWIIGIAIFGQSLKDFVTGIHFVSGLTVLSFSFGTAVLGIVLALICGYITGAVFAIIWNKLE